MKFAAQLCLGLPLLQYSVSCARFKKIQSRNPLGDLWSKLADPLRLPDEKDDAAHGVPGVDAQFVGALGNKPVFDYTSWGKEFEWLTFEQNVDHINAYHQQKENLDAETTTFKQRYWLNTKAWSGVEKKGPIFIIISPYGGFSTYAYGFIGEMSREMGAMVVQVEGRFAPDSLPFNQSGWEKKANRMGLVSSENALRDYVMLISHLRSQYDPDWVCPTATFGTSLAGMYAAWLRYKFPHIIDMSVASGSPMTGYPGTSDQFAFAKVITDAWLDATGDPECIDLIRASFKALDGDNCQGALWGSVYNEATYYSYPPRGRMSSQCARAKSVHAAGSAARTVALSLCGTACRGGCPAQPFTPSMWGYLSCTQVVNPIGSNSVTDFFPDAPWSLEGRKQACLNDWGIEPLEEGDYHAEIFGFHHTQKLADSTKRMMFNFGTYDAWTGFALATEDISEDIPVVMVKGSTHGGDLIGGRSDDTDDMLAARARISGILKGWISHVQGI